MNNPTMSTSITDYSVSLRDSFERAPKVDDLCPVCEGRDFAWLGSGDRHDLGLSLALCRLCSMVIISPLPDQSWFDQFYRDHFWRIYVGSRFTDLDDMYARDQCAERSEQIFEMIGRTFGSKPRSYLDIGCGQGAMLREFQRRFPEAHCAGVEPSHDAASYCLSRHGIPVETCTWESIKPHQLPGPFDLVTLIHVLEHVADPVDTLRRAATRLSPLGLIYAEVPDLLSPHWWGKDFIHIAHRWYFHGASLQNLYSRCGLEVVAVVRGAADIWPWGIGFIGRISIDDPNESNEISVAGAELLQQIKQHLKGRYLAANSEETSSSRKLGDLFDLPRTIRRFLKRA